MLVEEHLHLILVNSAHLLRRDSDLISILVAALLCDRINSGDRGTVVIQYTKLGQVRTVNGAARVMVLALVTLVNLSVETLLVD